MMRFVLKAAVMFVALMITGGKTCPGDELPDGWRLLGTKNEVKRLPHGAIQLLESRRSSAGVLSAKLKTPPRADAIFVEALAVCDARGLKFAALDAETGECVGYWTNPLAASKETRLTAVLTLSTWTKSIRLFVGTHRRGAEVTLRSINWTFLRRGVKHSPAVYGARIDASHSVRQTFQATGDRLGAVTFRVRHVRGFTDSLNLSVRIYRWKKDMATTMQSDPLAEFVVPGSRIPGTRQGNVDEVDLSATYLDGARELTVPLTAATKRGETLVLELAVDDSDEDGVGFITFGWLNGYDGGMLYENNSTRGRDWDLRLETFDVVE